MQVRRSLQRGRLATKFKLMLCMVVALFVSTMPALPIGAQETPQPPPTFNVSGTVAHGTAGATVPPDLIATLNIVTQNDAGQLDVQTQTAPISAGAYRFDSVSASVGASVFVTTSYGDVTQGSLITQVQAGQSDIDLPIMIYAPDNDPATVALLRAQYILDFLPGNLMQVLATYYYGVSGDRFFLSRERDGRGRLISVQIPLPIGAQSIAFTSNVNERYSVAGEVMSPVIVDTRPIIPQQQHEIVFSYQLPYSKGAPIDQDYPFATQMIEVLLPDDAGVKLMGENFTSNPNLTINPQRPYTQYNLTAPLVAGARLIYTLDGVPPVQVATPIPATTSTVDGVDFLPLLLGMIALLVVIVLIATSVLRPRRRP